MGWTWKTRKVLVREAARRYKRCRKKGKGRFLDEFVELTRYNRCYAARVLRAVGRGRSPSASRDSSGGKRGRRKTYTKEIEKPLVKIWAILNFPCGKRLVANIEEMILVLSKWKEIRVSLRLRRLLSL